jgi:TraB family protein
LLNRTLSRDFQLSTSDDEAPNFSFFSWSIENYLRSDQIYFVVVGAAHMGGPDGLLTLLRSRGCKIEQL